MFTLLSTQLIPALASVLVGNDGIMHIAEPGGLRSVDQQGSELWNLKVDTPYINGSFCGSKAAEPVIVQSPSAKGVLFATVGPQKLDNFCGPNGIDINNSLLAIDVQDGSVKWNVSLPCRVKGGQHWDPICVGKPVVVEDVVYVHVSPLKGTRGQSYVVALNAKQGTLLWNVSTGVTSKRLDPMVLAPDTILLPGVNDTDDNYHTRNGTHLALWSNGTQKWMRADLGCKPATQAKESTIYMVSVNGDDCNYVYAASQNLIALAKEDGRVLWSREMPGADAPVVADGSVYLYSYDRRYGNPSANVTAFDFDGELRWTFDMGAKPFYRLSPTEQFAVSAGEDGVDTLYFSNASVLLAVKEGRKLWGMDLMNGSACTSQYCSFSAPKVTRDGSVLVSGGGKDVPKAMHAIHAGQLVWSLEVTDYDVFQTPAMDENGITLVPEVSSFQGKLNHVQVSAVDSTGTVLWVDKVPEPVAVLV